MDIRKIDYPAALDFFLEHRAFREHVTMTTNGDWFGCFLDGKVVGIASTQQIGKWTRVKTLYVSKKYRRNGVASALVEHVSKGRQCTAFAFDASKPVFESAGFKHEKTQKNGIHFMRKS